MIYIKFVLINFKIKDENEIVGSLELFFLVHRILFINLLGFFFNIFKYPTQNSKIKIILVIYELGLFALIILYGIYFHYLMFWSTCKHYDIFQIMGNNIIQPNYLCLFKSLVDESSFID